MKQSWWSGQSQFGIKPGLERVAALLERLGNPQNAYPVVHVAGTNGKGSVAAMVAAALQAQRLTVGLYVSPDLGRITERVRIGPQAVDEMLWDELADEVERAGVGLAEVPSWFETVTALGFLAFKRVAVDVAVVEVGMGGRLDATNIVPPPLLAVVTPIAMDHMEFLGRTIEAIASEKAGIIKAGSELVLARQPFAAAREVIRRMAAARHVPVFEPHVQAAYFPDGVRLRADDGRDVYSPLLGVYQTINLETAWTAVERLAALGLIRDLETARQGIGSVRWPGRFQVLRENPWLVVDGAHNLHGVEGVAATLAAPPWNEHRWHVVFGVLADKAGDEMAAILARHASAITLTRVPGERGRDPRSLNLRPHPQLAVDVVDDPLSAVRQAYARLGSKDALLVTGSLGLLAHLNRGGLNRAGLDLLSIGDG